MTIRRILVPAGRGDAARAAIETALMSAKEFDAHVDAVHVRPDPQEAVPLLGEGVSGAMIEDLIALTENESKVHAEAARKLFDAALVTHGIPVSGDPSHAGPSASWHEVVGREDDVIVERGRLSDIVVASQPAREGEGTSELTLNAALFEGGRPVLVTPKPASQQLGGRVGIAWNGSAEAARAVSAALPFLEVANAVVVFSVETDGTPAELSAGLVEFLAWHRIDARVGDVPDDVTPVGEALLAACAADTIDFLVTGAYTHSRLRELILGGVTRHLLDRAAIPMMMSH